MLTPFKKTQWGWGYERWKVHNLNTRYCLLYYSYNKVRAS